MNVLDFGLDPQEAINVPHYMNRNGRTDLEIPIPGVTLDYDAEALAAELIESGHPVGIVAQESGLSNIQVVDCDDCGKCKGKSKVNCHKHSYLSGGADQRRDGAVRGR